MRYLVDTNVLLRRIDATSATHTVARKALSTLEGAGHEICILPQVIRELWNVCTRPQNANGFGMQPNVVQQIVTDLRATFTLLFDGLPVYEIWQQVVVQHQVLGVQVHDAYLAAAVLTYGLDGILTFNGNDFARYGITVLDPHNV